MFDNLYITQRIQKAQALREQNLNPYSNDLTRTMDNATFLRTYAHLLDSSQAPESTFDNAPILANSAKDSRIVDEKSGLSSDWQGSYLSGNDRSRYRRIHDFSQKANA